MEWCKTGRRTYAKAFWKQFLTLRATGWIAPCSPMVSSRVRCCFNVQVECGGRTMQQNTALSWTFPFCPTPPHWDLDWEGIENQFGWIRAMAGVEQDPFYHAVGDVLVHTGMVAAELLGLDAWRALPPQPHMQFFAAA